LAFSSWNEFKEKAGKFGKFLDKKRGDFRQNVQGLKDKHQTIDEIITTGVKFLPSPFDKIAEAVYKGSDGSDEQKLDKVKEYFEKIQSEGEEHYNELLENIKKNHEILENNLYQSYGLNWLPYDYFEHYKSNKQQDLEDWRNGFEFKLPAIKSKLELRRDRVVENIKERLESQNKLLIVGESGTSKTTILKEILCDYFDKEYLILYNWGTDEIKQGDQLVNFIGDILTEGKKILVVVDNAHTERVAAMFYVMDQISNHILNSNILFLLAARLPEFDLFVKDRLEQVQQGKESIRKFSKDPNFKYSIDKYTEDEIKAFIRKYVQMGTKIILKSLDVEPETLSRITVNGEQSIDRLSALIIKETNGLPIMIKFFLIGQGLRTDVERRYENYLKNYPERMHTMLVCSLLTISGLSINDDLLKSMNIWKAALNLDRAILYRDRDNKSWKTLHPRWDLELLSFLYNESDEAMLYERVKHLKNTIYSIFNFNDEKITAAVITTMYDISRAKNIPIDIVEDAIQNQLPDYLSNETKSVLYTLVIAYAYIELERYSDALTKCKKALDIDPNYAYALNNKGLVLGKLGESDEKLGMKYNKEDKKDEAVNCFDKAIKYFKEAIEYFDKALEIKSDYDDALFNKGWNLAKLGKYKEQLGDEIAIQYYNEAIEYFDKTLEINPNYYEKVSDSKKRANKRLVDMWAIERFSEAG
jgi:tetratricopeptide (TPR) repeat protein